MRGLVFALTIISAAAALTCYDGMKLLRMQGVGTSTTECSSGSYCYNMTASAYLLVDFVKAGCSTYRCMLAPNQCISTYFQLIPVSLCCCSHDRCNVGGNPQAITEGGGSGYNYNYGGGDNNNNNNGKTSGSDYNYGGNNNNNQNRGGSGYDYNYGGGSAGSGGQSPSAGKSNKKFTAKEIEDRFRDYDVDHRGDHNGGGEEESFQKVNAFTTPSTRRGSSPSGRNSGGSNPGSGGEIEILDSDGSEMKSRSNRQTYQPYPSNRRGNDYNNREENNNDENQPGSAWGGEYDRKFSQQRPENEDPQGTNFYNDESRPGSAWGESYDRQFGTVAPNSEPGYPGGQGNNFGQEDDGRTGSAWGDSYDQKFRTTSSPTYRQDEGSRVTLRPDPYNNDEGAEIEI